MEQHVNMMIGVKGLDKVAFVTEFGWADNMGISIDANNLPEAVSTAIDYLQGLSPVPFENMCDNEEYVAEANDAITEFIDEIIGFDEMPEAGKIAFTLSYPIQICIELTNTYVVNFGG